MRMTVIGVGIATVLIIGLLDACTSVRAGSGSVGHGNGSSKNGDLATAGASTPRRQLQARLMAFADRYLNRISEACDELEAERPTPECRIAAHATKYYPSLTVLSLSCQAEPE